MSRLQLKPVPTCFFLAFVLFWSFASAQETSKLDPSQLGSLKRIPATAGSYWVSTNHSAMMTAVFESEAWKSIKNSEVSKRLKKANRRGKTRGYDDYNVGNPAAQYLQFYDSVFNNIATQSVLEVVKQIAEHEVFYYVDNDFVSVVDAMKQSFTAVAEIADGQMMEDLSEENQQEILNRALRSFKDIRCPTLMMGARLEDPRGFRALLEVARVGIETFMDNQAPDFRDMWKVVDDGGDFLLTMQVDFEKLPLGDLDELDEKQIASIRELLDGQKLVLAMGIVDNLVMTGIAESVSAFVDFGKEELLVDLPELEKLNKSIEDNESIVSAYYLSKEMAQSSSSWTDLYDSIMPMLEMAMEDEMIDMPEAQRQQARKFPGWIKKVLVDIERFSPKPAMQYGYSVLNDEGIKGFQCQNRLHPGLDGSKPLNVEGFANGSTLLFMTQRPKNLEPMYDAIVDWIVSFPVEFDDDFQKQILDAVESVEAGKLAGTVDDPANSDQAGEVKKKVEETKAKKIFASISKLANSIHKTTKNYMLPSIEGCQAGISVELKKLTFSDKSIWAPMPSMVCETKKDAGINKALDEYHTAIIEFADESKEYRESPELNQIRPVRKQIEEGASSLRWPIGEQEAIDIPLAPGVTFAKSRLVATLIESHAQEILSDQSDINLFGPAVTNQPSASLFFYNNRHLLSDFPTWFEGFAKTSEVFGILIDFEQYEAKRDTLKFSQEQIRDHLERIWNFANCWKGYSSRMYEDSGSMITEYEYRFQDIESEKSP